MLDNLDHSQIMNLYKQIQSYLAKRRFKNMSEEDKHKRAMKGWETRLKNKRTRRKRKSVV